MKKVMCFVIAIMMIIPLISLSIYAEEPVTGVITLSVAESARRGENVTVSMELNINPGIIGMRFILDYDKEVLELVSVKDLGVFPGAMFGNDVKAEEYTLFWANNLAKEDITKTGRIAEITFKVKEDAPIKPAFVNLNFSKDGYDIMNKALKNVPFEVRPDEVNVTCIHQNVTENVLWQATFEDAGKKVITCDDCGKVIEEKMLPKLQTQEGVKAEVQPGEFESGVGEDYLEPTLTFLRITSGEEYDNIIKLFPNASCVFKIKFTKNGLDYVPMGETKISLDNVCEFGMKTRLYKVINSQSCEEVACSKLDKELVFNYENAVFFLCDDQDPAVPETSTVPYITADPDDLIVSREKFIIVCAIVAVIFFGGLAAAFIVRGKDKNI